jgi:hypothetical protein
MMLLNTLMEVINSFAGHTSVNGPGGFHLDGPFFFVASIVLFIAIVYVTSLVWVWQDARQRGKSSLVTVLFILLTGWPASFIWWFWLRPPSTVRQ